MRSWLLAVVIAGAACGKSADKPADKPADKTAILESFSTLTEVTVDELEGMLAHGSCSAIDANGQATRKKMGVIPGAVLLSDYETFAASELPKDPTQQLVFYCANTHCDASHTAALRAITVGFKKVMVMPGGIAGWVKAGKKTAQTL